MKKKVVIVVPTLREASFMRFLNEWDQEFFHNQLFNVHLIVMEDNPEKTFSIPISKQITHFSWKDIKDDLGDKSWIIPRRSDCVRSFGYYKAYQMKPDMIVTLDDDCYPLGKYMDSVEEKGLLEAHWEQLFGKPEQNNSAWINTIQQYRPRGLPYKNTSRKNNPETILNHGLWYNVPDFDGTTQLSLEKATGLTGYAIQQNIPRGMYYPMCGMNIAWKTELTPALYFMLMGKDATGKSFGFDRFGDIWAGIISKKIIDHLGYQVRSGSPIIWHDRASDAQTNIIKEAPGKEINESFWQIIDSINLSGTNIVDCYLEIAGGLNIPGEYWDNLRRAMKIWGKLFKA